MIQFANQYQSVILRQVLFGMNHAEAGREQQGNTQPYLWPANNAGHTFQWHCVLLSAFACAQCRETCIVSSMASVGQPCLEASTGLADTLKCWPSSSSAT